MNGAEFVRTIIGEMHGAMRADVKDLTPKHLAWKPASGAQSHRLSVLALRTH